jgi:hypothetical protein
VAVIIPGALISDIRGKVGDVVFERNAGGLYVRSKGTVTQDPSDPRDAARAALELCSFTYRTIVTQTQREGWTAYARAYPDTDRWGHSKVRTGQQAFVSFNFHAALGLGQVWNTLPPTNAPCPKAIVAATIFAAAEVISIATPWDGWTYAPTYQRWFAYQGVPVYATRNYFSSPWRYAGHFTHDTGGWPGAVQFPTAFHVDAGKTSWIKLYYNAFDPMIEARPIIVKATRET